MGGTTEPAESLKRLGGEGLGGAGIGFPSRQAKACGLLGSDIAARTHSRPRAPPPPYCFASFSLILKPRVGQRTTGLQAKAPVPPSSLHPRRTGCLGSFHITFRYQG